MALTQISTAGVKDDAVTAGKIPANAVGSSELADNAVDTAAIAADAVTTAKIAAGNITATELGSDSVTGAKIAAGAINNANKIQDSIITGAKIGSGTITDGNLATNSVTTGKIANDAVTVDKVADDAIGVAQLSASGTASSSTFLRGDNSWTAVTSTTINNNADNRVITGSGTANTLEAESSLTWDQTNLTVSASNPHIIAQRSGAASNNADPYLNIDGQNSSGTNMGEIRISRHSGTDDSRIELWSKTAGQNPQPSFRIDATGSAYFVGKLGRDISNQPSFMTDQDSDGNTVPAVAYVRTLTNGGETGLFIRGASQGGGSTSTHSCLKVHATGCANNAKQVGIDLLAKQQLIKSTTGIYCKVEAAYDETRVFDGYLDKNIGAYTNGYTYYSKISETNSGGNTYHFRGDLDGTQKVRITRDGDLDNANNSYGSLSDVKLKENIVDAKSQWDDIKALKVRNFNLKADPDKVKMLGLIAQEAETVSAGLIKTENDIELDPETGKGKTVGTTKYVKYSILYMKAIKALQEAMAKIEVLEAKVAALEAK